MPQRSHLIPDLCSLCHTNSGLTLHPSSSSAFSGIPRITVWHKLPGPLAQKQPQLPTGMSSASFPWLGCSAVGYCCPCGISKHFPRNVSVDTSGIVLLPTGRGCSLGPTQLRDHGLGAYHITKTLSKTQPFSLMHFCYEAFYCGTWAFVALVALLLLCVLFLRVSFHWRIFRKLSCCLILLQFSHKSYHVLLSRIERFFSKTYLQGISLYPCQVAVGSKDK